MMSRTRSPTLSTRTSFGLTSTQIHLAGFALRRISAFQLVDVGTVLDTHEANGKRDGVDERLARDGFFKIEVFDAEVIRRLVFRNLDRADAVFEKIALLVIDIYGVIQAVYNLRQRAEMVLPLSVVLFPLPQAAQAKSSVSASKSAVSFLGFLMVNFLSGFKIEGVV